MKKKLLILLFLNSVCYTQTWKSYDVATKGNILAAMVIGNLNDTIYVSGNDGSSLYNSFIYSKDKGATWSQPKGVLTDDYGKVGQYVGVKDRLYAALQLPFKDYLYYHSLDNGETWVIDTVGLPHYYNIKSYQKQAFTLKKLGNEHIVAYNTSYLNTAYYKKTNDNSWKPLNSSTSNIQYGFATLNNTWYSLSFGNVLTKSIDQGESWTTIETSGLPSTMYASFLVANGTDRLFVGASIASGTNKTAVYYSDDEGKTWHNTNAEILMPYTSAYDAITNIYAIKNRVIVTYTSAAYNEPPIYLYSDAETPNFTLGNTSGLTNGIFAFPNVFFNIDDVFYLNYNFDLRSMDTNSLSVKSFKKDIVLNLFPNPVNDHLNIKSKNDFSWKLNSILGKSVKKGKYRSNSETSIDLSDISEGIYIFSTNNGYSKKIIKN